MRNWTFEKEVDDTCGVPRRTLGTAWTRTNELLILKIVEKIVKV